MQFLFDSLPVFFFLVAFYKYGIYMATVVGIIATFLQAVTTRLWVGKWDKTQLVMFIVFLVLGGMTLYFHDPIFVKLKPTIVYWAFAIAIIVSQLFMAKPLIQMLMEKVLQEKGEVPGFVWRNLNLAWAGFFLLIGSVNLYVAYYFSNDIWVNFHFYGITGALLAISIFQAIYLMRYLPEDKKDQ